MGNDLTESVKIEIRKKALSLKTLNEEIRKLQNYQRTLETQILDFYEVYGIEHDEIDGVAVKDATKPKEVALKEILEVFPNQDIKTVLENVIGNITIDLEKTEENLRFSAEFPEPIIKSLIKQLCKLSKETAKKVEV
jgi:hypothetical protein